MHKPNLKKNVTRFGILILIIFIDHIAFTNNYAFALSAQDEKQLPILEKICKHLLNTSCPKILETTGDDHIDMVSNFAFNSIILFFLLSLLIYFINKYLKNGKRPIEISKKKRFINPARVIIYLPLFLFSYCSLNTYLLDSYRNSLLSCKISNNPFPNSDEIISIKNCIESKTNPFLKLKISFDQFDVIASHKIDPKLIGNWLVKKKDTSYFINLKENGQYEIDFKVNNNITSSMDNIKPQGLWGSSHANNIVWFSHENPLLIESNKIDWINENEFINYETDYSKTFLKRVTFSLEDTADLISEENIQQNLDAVDNSFSKEWDQLIVWNDRYGPNPAPKLKLRLQSTDLCNFEFNCTPDEKNMNIVSFQVKIPNSISFKSSANSEIECWRNGYTSNGYRLNDCPFGYTFVDLHQDVLLESLQYNSTFLMPTHQEPLILGHKYILEFWSKKDWKTNQRNFSGWNCNSIQIFSNPQILEQSNKTLNASEEKNINCMDSGTTENNVFAKHKIYIECNEIACTVSFFFHQRLAKFRIQSIQAGHKGIMRNKAIAATWDALNRMYSEGLSVPTIKSRTEEAFTQAQVCTKIAREEQAWSIRDPLKNSCTSAILFAKQIRKFNPDLSLQLYEQLAPAYLSANNNCLPNDKVSQLHDEWIKLLIELNKDKIEQAKALNQFILLTKDCSNASDIRTDYLKKLNELVLILKNKLTVLELHDLLNPKYKPSLKAYKDTDIKNTPSSPRVSPQNKQSDDPFDNL